MTFNCITINNLIQINPDDKIPTKHKILTNNNDNSIINADKDNIIFNIKILNTIK